ncbi:MAG: N-acetyl-gamma-glutamyl-phosphate reductase [Gemmatimonadetes bacterium]|nr:N-acetyl-gamma-glutamyl-phosphate reductase [Gemmatimonadota bacterium]MBT5145202.1 N-acetyl-gamma-glutamyl-phosphate reductase [Gemmatimonadota bacterium]MBT5965360.1 N-acetyl-gamma-glutamyl-phosphate reductase [Gemmatimonadota bacterium]
MNKPRVYIDGQEGTTGLRIRELLAARNDLDVMLIPVEHRKDDEVRRQYLNDADLAILCLPDEAAAAAIGMVTPSAGTRIIDTSTVRRVSEDWVYGVPELSAQQRQAIRVADRVANCGCYPVGFLLAVRPLIEAGLLADDVALTINAVSGYSGGGRRMIEDYQSLPPGTEGDGARPLCLYGLDGAHKHMAEMCAFSGTSTPPLFVPSVDHTFCGMLTSTPIPATLWKGNVDADAIWDVLRDRYTEEPFVRVVAPGDNAEHLRDGRYLDLSECNFTNRLDLFVFGDPQVGFVLVGRQDNLGKGASGNAVQCLNLMIGAEETTGLTDGLDG